MSKIISIGEALIDMIPSNKGDMKKVEGFTPYVGGAPLNVCGAVSKLGGKSYMITKLGNDGFGEKIIDYMNTYNINSDYVIRTNEAKTGLAFVTLLEEGKREFTFYRNPSADMLLDEDEIKEDWFKDCYALHFCSVDLIEAPVKYAHLKAIDYALKNNSIISFDPNLRFNLWDDKELLKKTVLEFIPYANILKISDEELEFITGCKEILKAKKNLFKGNVKIVIYTCGSNGSYILTKNDEIFVNSMKVNAIDTTGAGDGFIGAFLYKLLENNINLDLVTKPILKEYLEFANKFAGISVCKNGAIGSYPNKKEMMEEI